MIVDEIRELRLMKQGTKILWCALDAWTLTAILIHTGLASGTQEKEKCPLVRRKKPPLLYQTFGE